MRWGIEDFKGLRSATIDLAPGKLSVLTGVNSSGKSSALQSLLMMTQSLYHSGDIVLNGPLVRLGDAADLVRDGASPERIGLSLQLVEAQDTESGTPGPIHAHISLSPSVDSVTLRTDRLEFGHEFDKHYGSLVLDKARSRGADLELAVNATQAASTEEFLHVKETFVADKQALRTYVRMEGLEPVEIVQLSTTEGIKSKYRSAISSFLEELAAGKYDASRRKSASLANDYLMYSAVNEFVDLINSSLSGDATESSGDIRKLLESSRRNPYLFSREWKSTDSDVRAHAIDIAVEARSIRPYLHVALESSFLFRPRSSRFDNGILEQRFSATYSQSISALVTLAESLNSISSRVQYLGPLRDEPRVVWSQWNELARGLPVGTRGEFSAVRLSQNAGRITRYCRPDGETVFGPLSEAVDEWLAYLQIGDSVSASSEGKLGVRLELKLAGQGRDLTAVGVGVSQALPLVVAVLAVPEDSIFIVEQPELHLHPAVQARLADFLLGARPDLTTVVETHSDAFVTRIRRRVAEGVIPQERVEIAFVEPTKGGSTMRILTVTELGDLTEWPTGFISGDDEDTRAILRANLGRVGK